MDPDARAPSAAKRAHAKLSERVENGRRLLLALECPRGSESAVERVRKTIEELRKIDKEGYFCAPVTEDIAPGYFSVVDRPMDFYTMSKKLQEGEYHTWRDLVDDFETMCSNATKYNRKGLPVYKAAQTLLRRGREVIKRKEIMLRSAFLELHPESIAEDLRSLQEAREHVRTILQEDMAAWCDPGASSLKGEPNSSQEELEALVEVWEEMGREMNRCTDNGNHAEGDFSDYSDVEVEGYETAVGNPNEVKGDEVVLEDCLVQRILREQRLDECVLDVSEVLEEAMERERGRLTHAFQTEIKDLDWRQKWYELRSRYLCNEASLLKCEAESMRCSNSQRVHSRRVGKRSRTLETAMIGSHPHLSIFEESASLKAEMESGKRGSQVLGWDEKRIQVAGIGKIRKAIETATNEAHELQLAINRMKKELRAAAAHEAKKKQEGLEQNLPPVLQLPSIGSAEISKKKQRVGDPDAVVILHGVGAPKFVEPVKTKEILTPRARDLRALGRGFHSPETNARRGSGDISSEEDTDSETYMQRHAPLEAAERARYMSIAGDKKSRGSGAVGNHEEEGTRSNGCNGVDRQPRTPKVQSLNFIQRNAHPVSTADIPCNRITNGDMDSALGNTANGNGMPPE